MLQRSLSRERDVSSTAPRSTCFSDKQMNDYLSNLRNNRIARPNGSRPPPSQANRKLPSRDGENGRRSSSSGSNNDVSRSGSSSVLSYYRTSGSVSSGRASPEKMLPPPLRTSEERQKAREESHAVRLALEQTDAIDEQSVHLAAQKEAAELVWKHENPDAPFRVHPSKEIDLQQHDNQRLALTQEQAFCPSSNLTLPLPQVMRENDHAENSADQPRRSPSKRLRESLSIGRLASRRRSSASLRNVSGTIRKSIFPNAEEKIWEDKPKDETKQQPSVQERPVPLHVRRNPFARAQSMKQGQQPVVEKARPLHRTEIQKNPPTQSRNPSYTRSDVSAAPISSEKEPATLTQETEESDIKYKDGVEIRGDDIRAATSMRMRDRSPKLPSPTVVSGSPGRPIVSFEHDWQPNEKDQHAGAKVTSMLPSRPHVSPLRAQAKSQQTASAPAVPTVSHVASSARNDNAARNTHMPIPQICLPDDDDAQESPSSNLDHSSKSITPTPSIAISAAPDPSPSTEFDTPTISISTDPDTASSTPTPTPSQMDRNKKPANKTTRPPPRHAETAPISTATMTTTTTTDRRSHWSPDKTTNAALCAQCALPIGGRIVTAAGTRFHPQCFTCHHCNEGLECVAFYPEPAATRTARLERMERRLAGEDVEPPEGQTMADDSDDALRFYCHLDFHEFFSPRCKSCKTPIEGEVVVACGAEWHVGHFFCAQCGDPFDPSTPFVEKDGYAWCIACHTNRTSARCKKCRKPVTDTVLKALGAEWHQGCFRCLECDGGFEDGRYFLRGESQDPVCSGCEARRLKA